MFAYFSFLGFALLQWILLFPNGKLVSSHALSYKHKKIFLMLICVELIIFTGLRAPTIGADTGIYVQALNYYRDLPHDQILSAPLVYPFDFEIGYFIFTKVCAYFSLNTTAFLLLVSFIIYVPIFKFIKQYSEDPMISLLTYFSFGFFGYSLGIFRQMIALSLVLCGIKYIQNGKLKSWIVLVIIATLVHTTAIITFPLYWIVKFRVKNKLGLIIIIEAILFVFARQIVVFIAYLFPKYRNYVNSEYDIQGGSYIFLILLNLVFLLGYYLLIKGRIKEDKIFIFTLNALLVAIFLQILGYSMEIFGRIIPYYSIYLLILIPKTMNCYLRRNRLIWNIIIIGGLLMIFYIITKDNITITPYLFYWN